MPGFKLTEHQLDFMDTFGYLHLPGLLNDRIDRVTEAFEELMTCRGGADHDGSSRFCVVPGLNHNACLCSLLDDDRIAGIATSLLGDDYQYWNSDSNYYMGDTRWHSDTVWPPPIRFYKFGIYLDPMTRDNGALRVIPGSHRAGEPYAEIIHRQLTGEAPWGGIHGSDVPAQALETQPGDLAIFNHATKHSAWGGSDRRRMFTVIFTDRHTGESLRHFLEIIRNHGYSKRDVFGEPGGPLLGTATPNRRRHLEQLLEHIPDDASELA